jgi:hypothetical protein
MSRLKVPENARPLRNEPNYNRRELSVQTMDLRLLVQRCSGGPLVDALCTDAGAPGFLDRLWPGAP